MSLIFDLLDAIAAWRRRRAAAERERRIAEFEANLRKLSDAGAKAAETIRRGNLPR